MSRMHEGGHCSRCHVPVSTTSCPLPGMVCMRISAWMLIVGLLSVVAGGCATSRATTANSGSSKAAPEERVRYGMPWSNGKSSTKVADSKSSGSKELPPELAAKLAEARASGQTKKSTKATEILKRAAEAESRGDLDMARASYLEVLAESPNHAEAHHRLGVIADMSHDPKSADEHYAKAYSANPRDADLLSDMGYSLYLRGRLDAAEARLKEALERNPYHRSALTNLGLVYGKQGKYDAALAMFRQSGTESEAQQNIAALFPNGKPSSSGGNGSMLADATSSPRGESTGATSSQAPPFPPHMADSDQNLIALQQHLASNAAQRPSSGPAGANPSAVRSQPDAFAWADQGAADRQHSPGPASNPTGAATGSPFWQGALNSNTTASTNGSSPNVAANGNQAAPFPTTDDAFSAWANDSHASNQPPRGNTQLTAGQIEWSPAPQTSGAPSQWAAQMALGTGPGSMFPQARPTNAGTLPVPQSNPVSPWGNPAPVTSGPRPATGGATSQQGYAEVPFGALGAQPVQQAAWGTPPHGTTSQPSAHWGEPSVSNYPQAAMHPNGMNSNTMHPVASGSSSNINPSSNWQQLAPPSPWDQVTPVNNWDDRAASFGDPASGSQLHGTAPYGTQPHGMQPAGSQPHGAPVNGANAGANSAGNAMPLSGVTLWPSSPAGGAEPGVRSQPNAAQSLPIVTPGPTAPAFPPQNSSSGGTSSQGTQSGTTVPNWPYAPSRP